jgi:hypothetical protein
MAIAMFLDRVPVSESAVRKALHSILADPKAANLDREALEELADDRVKYVRRRGRRISLTQEWNKMSRATGNREALPDILTAIIHAQQVGTFPSDEAVEETRTMLGASTEDVVRFYEYQTDIRPAALRESVDTITMEELRAGQAYF